MDLISRVANWSAVAAAGAAGFFLKPLLSQQNIFVLTVVVAIALYALSKVEGLIAWAYEESAWLRRSVDRVFGKTLKTKIQHYIEGTWVDVGYEEDETYYFLRNYSIIQITRVRDGYDVHGRTWEISGADNIWESTKPAILNGRTLEFDYISRNQDTSKEGASGTCRFNLAQTAPFLATSWTGSYAKTRTEASRLSEKPGESEEKLAAERFVQRYKSEHNYSEENARAKAAPTMSDYTWFAAFSVATDSKKAEREHIAKHASEVKLPATPITALDIGSGDGALSRTFLQECRPAPRSRYFSVDPQGSALDASTPPLRLTMPGVNIVPLKQTLQEFLDTEDATFDLVMLLHCLYYVDNHQEALQRLFKRLNPGATLVAMHTIETPSSKVMSDAIAAAKSVVNFDGPKTIETLAGHANFKVVTHLGTQPITFPALSSVQRGMLREGSMNDPHVNKTAALISFLVNRGWQVLRSENNWEAVVDVLDGTLKMQRPQIDLQVKLQIVTAK